MHADREVLHTFTYGDVTLTGVPLGGHFSGPHRTPQSSAWICSSDLPSLRGAQMAPMMPLAA